MDRVIETWRENPHPCLEGFSVQDGWEKRMDWQNTRAKYWYPCLNVEEKQIVDFLLPGPGQTGPPPFVPKLLLDARALLVGFGPNHPRYTQMKFYIPLTVGQVPDGEGGLLDVYFVGYNLLADVAVFTDNAPPEVQNACIVEEYLRAYRT